MWRGGEEEEGEGEGGAEERDVLCEWKREEGGEGKHSYRSRTREKEREREHAPEHESPSSLLLLPETRERVPRSREATLDNIQHTSNTHSHTRCPHSSSTLLPQSDASSGSEAPPNSSSVPLFLASFPLFLSSSLLPSIDGPWVDLNRGEALEETAESKNGRLGERGAHGRLPSHPHEVGEKGGGFGADDGVAHHLLSRHEAHRRHQTLRVDERHHSADPRRIEAKRGETRKGESEEGKKDEQQERARAGKKEKERHTSEGKNGADKQTQPPLLRHEPQRALPPPLGGRRRSRPQRTPRRWPAPLLLRHALSCPPRPPPVSLRRPLPPHPRP